MPGYFEYVHTVGSEETNLVGNVYYASYLSWQGRCWDMFLKEKDLTGLLSGELTLSTVRAECDFFSSAAAFDDLSVRMRLEEFSRCGIELNFDYVRVRDGLETLVARGRWRIACARSGSDDDAEPAQLPVVLRAELLPYADTPVPTVPRSTPSPRTRPAG